MLIDLHIHTVHGSSDSELSPAHLVEEARRVGLHGVCLTEHRGPWDRYDFQRLAEEQNGLLLVRAMEVETDMGHILAFGLDAYVPGINKAQELRRVADEAGAYLVLAHPFRAFFNPPQTSRNLLFPEVSHHPTTPEKAVDHPAFSIVDAIEVANGNNTAQENRFALEVARLLGKPCTGGSDAHSISGIGACLTRFEDALSTQEEFLRALHQGRFSPAIGLSSGHLQPFGPTT